MDGKQTGSCDRKKGCRGMIENFLEAIRTATGGALVGMRSVFTLTGKTDLERFVNDLLERLKQQ